MKCPVCGNDNPPDAQFCVRCGTSLSARTGIGAVVVQDNSIRYHGLDALRGMAMLLGIVLHAALPYMPNVEEFWPTDESSSPIINTIFQFIHIWRMPLFFILAGFFANLIISKNSWKSWWGNRLLRIAIPIVVFTGPDLQVFLFDPGGRVILFEKLNFLDGNIIQVAWRRVRSTTQPGMRVPFNKWRNLKESTSNTVDVARFGFGRALGVSS